MFFPNLQTGWVMVTIINQTLIIECAIFATLLAGKK